MAESCLQRTSLWSFCFKTLGGLFQSENLQKLYCENVKILRAGSPGLSVKWLFRINIQKSRKRLSKHFEKLSNRVDSSQDWNKIPQSAHFMIISNVWNYFATKGPNGVARITEKSRFRSAGSSCWLSVIDICSQPLLEAVSELNGIGKFNQEIAEVKRISCSVYPSLKVKLLLTSS